MPPGLGLAAAAAAVAEAAAGGAPAAAGPPGCCCLRCSPPSPPTKEKSAMPAAWPGEVLEARLQGAARYDQAPVRAPGRLQQRLGGPN